ncbi:hypothetical protein [Citrobacter portucalensis]|uniref:hypothetical protein n=1 Tax=Citrobacter portucalensis TaxID=1639133 RepID=UPI001A2DA91E|nr:hypothetical protein [Citrobacter portucalensis]
MDSKNSDFKIKKVSFDWKEINKSELSSSYRVVCKVIFEVGLEIEGSNFYTWYKPNANPLGPINYGNAEINAEHEAFKLALSRAHEIFNSQTVPR